MKEKILNKATDMFLTLGFKSVTMDDLAHEMGISKKTIYAHFENKSKLVEASTIGVSEAISLGIEHICSLHKNPIEELYEIKKFAMKNLKDEKASPQYQLQKYYPRIHKTLRKKWFSTMQSCIVQNLNRGISMHIYRPSLNINFISRIYFTGVTSIKDHTFFPEDEFPKKQLMDDYLEYHLRGIITPEGLKILNKIIHSNNQ